MILTKSEFKDEFGFKNLSSVSNLLKAKKIIATPDGLIDLNNKKNKKWIETRKKQLQKDNKKNASAENGSSNSVSAGSNIAKDNGLSLDIQHQRLEESLKKNALLGLKLAKENKDVIETKVLNRVIALIFDALFKQLSELPGLYVDDVINIILAGEESREKIIAFLTDKILTSLKSALEIAEKQAKKYYE